MAFSSSFHHFSGTIVVINMEAANPFKCGSGGFAISCKACGAPSMPDAESCSYCGAEERYDIPTRRRLAAHRARMRRALQQLRAIVTTQVKGDTSQVMLIAVAALFLPIPLMAIGFAIPFGIFFFLSWLLKWKIFLYLGFLFAFVGCMIGLIAGLAVPYYSIKRQGAKVRTQARRIVLELELTTSVICENCGGHATVVALGPDEPYPCPWCDTGLLPSAPLEESVQLAAQALLTHHQELDPNAIAHSSREEPVLCRGTPPPGYVQAGGGCIVKGRTEGIPIRAFNDLYEGVFILRIEVPVETSINGEIWFVRPEVEESMRNLTREWGYTMPATPSASSRRDWKVYTDGVETTSLSAVDSALDQLGTQDSLLIDPAGLSLCRKAFGLSYKWGLFQDHHATLAALARALQTQNSAKERVS